MKDQFQSNEPLEIFVGPFIDKTTGAELDGVADTCTVTREDPNGSVTTSVADWDANIGCWHYLLSTGGFVRGVWRFKFTSADVNARAPQRKVISWGDYVDKLNAAPVPPVFLLPTYGGLITVFLKDGATGLGKTGVVYGGVTCHAAYPSNEDGYYLEFDFVVDNNVGWTEIDAVKLPGWYSVYVSGDYYISDGRYPFNFVVAGCDLSVVIVDFEAYGLAEVWQEAYQAAGNASSAESVAQNVLTATGTPTPPHTMTEYLLSLLTALSGTAGAVAHATATCSSLTGLVNNDWFTLVDTLGNSVTFEYKVTGGFTPTPGRTTINIVGQTLSTAMTLSIYAIDSSKLYISASYNGGQGFGLAQVFPGLAGNTTPTWSTHNTLSLTAFTNGTNNVSRLSLLADFARLTSGYAGVVATGLLSLSNVAYVANNDYIAITNIAGTRFEFEFEVGTPFTPTLDRILIDVRGLSTSQARDKIIEVVNSNSDIVATAGQGNIALFAQSAAGTAGNVKIEQHTASWSCFSVLGMRYGEDNIARLPTVVDAAAATDELAGLLGKNSYEDSQVYDADNRMTSCRIRTYDTAANATTHGATGLLHAYAVTATFAGRHLTGYLFTLDDPV